MTLAPGFYELTEDVTNAYADRRSKTWHKLPVIPKGTKFILMNYKYLDGNDRVKEAQELTVLGYPYDRIKVGMLRGYPEQSQLAAVILPFLEKRNETVRTLFAQFGWEAYHPHAVPQALFRMGKITLDDLRQAHAFLEAEGAPLEVLVDAKP